MSWGIFGALDTTTTEIQPLYLLNTGIYLEYFPPHYYHKSLQEVVNDVSFIEMASHWNQKDIKCLTSIGNCREKSEKKRKSKTAAAGSDNFNMKANESKKYAKTYCFDFNFSDFRKKIRKQIIFYSCD